MTEQITSDQTAEAEAADEDRPCGEGMCQCSCNYGHACGCDCPRCPDCQQVGEDCDCPGDC